MMRFGGFRVMKLVWLLALVFFNVASPACSRAGVGEMYLETESPTFGAAPLEGGVTPPPVEGGQDVGSPMSVWVDAGPSTNFVWGRIPASVPFPAAPEVPTPTAGADEPTLSPVWEPTLAPSPSPAPAFVPAPSPALVPAPSPALVPAPSPALVPAPSPSDLAGVVPLLPPSEGKDPDFSPPSSESTVMRTMAIMMAGGAGACILAIVVMMVVCRVSRKNRAAAVLPWKVGMSGPMQKPFVAAIPAITRAEVEVACEDFSNIIGSSPDSVVFKGTLADGTEIAATSIRMSSDSWTSMSEIFFRLKIESLARMSHTHLVNLVSYCSEDDPFARMFIFEYASNGTLYEHLHLKESEHLSWPIRMRIIMGAAYGLRYMHHELEPPVSHQNYDSRAIYLTEDYAAKLAAEFGVSKGAVVKSDRRRSRSRSTSRSGVEYDDSEGSDRHAPDFEGNVYSFGILLLEVVSGRRPHSEKEGSLVDWASSYINNADKLHTMADPSLESYDCSQLVTICQVSRLCTHSDPQKRVTMKEATGMLETALKMTPEITAPKGSLLWAELEILTST